MIQIRKDLLLSLSFIWLLRELHSIIDVDIKVLISSPSSWTKKESEGEETKGDRMMNREKEI